jgi:hypothetical protein
MRNKAKRNSSLFFRFYLLFSLFFAFFRFKFFVSLRFSNFCFKAKQSEAKLKPIFSFFSLFSLFSLFFRFFSLFLLNFRFASIFSLNFRLFYLRFRFWFLVFRIEVNHVKSGFFSLPSETKFSLQFQISLSKRKWGRTLIRTHRGTWWMVERTLDFSLYVLFLDSFTYILYTFKMFMRQKRIAYFVLITRQ